MRFLNRGEESEDEKDKVVKDEGDRFYLYRFRFILFRLIPTPFVYHSM